MNITMKPSKSPITMKPSKSPTQGQPNPRKIRLKVAFGPLFPTEINFWWVGIGLVQETDYDKPNPSKFSVYTVFFRGLFDILTHPVLPSETVLDVTVLFAVWRCNRGRLVRGVTVFLRSDGF